MFQDELKSEKIKSFGNWGPYSKIKCIQDAFDYSDWELEVEEYDSDFKKRHTIINEKPGWYSKKEIKGLYANARDNIDLQKVLDYFKDYHIINWRYQPPEWGPSKIILWVSKQDETSYQCYCLRKEIEGYYAEIKDLNEEIKGLRSSIKEIEGWIKKSKKKLKDEYGEDYK